jgi:AraC family transcriptional regulator of adaptative response / DNA-3-methyladenine glycosylase II
MTLDWRVCSRARLARDARFDGKFFIGVFSTGIYCRPICRARTSRESSVCYFPSAAAAAEAGFRPCLRCRPESSPGTPAWAGTQTTVARALRLISETGLEDGGVEALAEHLGVGSRHLRRLFLRHLGATPSAIAQTRRLHFTKKLIDETTLSMTQIALASGFGSVRRFNAAIRRIYDRTPTQIRRLARAREKQPENQYLFHLNFRPPYDWKRILEFLAAYATPRVEAVERDRYCRSISLQGRDGCLEVSLDATRNVLEVRVRIADPRLLFLIIERVRAMFDVDADWATISKTLGPDPHLGPLIRSYPGLRVPGCWDGFELTVRTILGEELSVEQGRALAGRMAEEFGRPYSLAKNVTHLFPAPENLLTADLESIGVPHEKAATIRELARATHDNLVNFGKVMDSKIFSAQLRKIPGVHPLLEQYLAMRACREPDAFPSADPILIGSMGLKSAAALETRSRNWQPWRAYAAVYLWSFARARKSAATTRRRSSHQRNTKKSVQLER